MRESDHAPVERTKDARQVRDSGERKDVGGNLGAEERRDIFCDAALKNAAAPVWSRHWAVHRDYHEVGLCPPAKPR